MNSDQIAYASVDEIGKAYREGCLSPVDVTDFCLGRIERFEPALHAFTRVLCEEARSEARVAERELNSNIDRGPLHGIPIGVKDLVDMRDLPTSCASPARRGHFASRDSPLIESLHRAGAVLIGKTNLIEFAHMSTHPDLDRTNNPWDVKRTSGGSSGGSAAALAAGFCYGAIGTDTGGSIRIPASWCGVVGLKPTFGLLPTDGVFPCAPSLDTVGPMARTCQDAAHLLAALRRTPAKPKSVSLTGMRFGILQHPMVTSQIASNVAAVFDDTCEVVRQAGATVSEVNVEHLNLSCGANMLVIGPEFNEVHSDLYSKRCEDYGPDSRVAMAIGASIPAASYIRAQRFRRFLAQRLLAAMKGLDALLSPTVCITSPETDPISPDGVNFVESLFAAPFNLSGLPALTIPCGLDSEGLPVGIQVVGRPHSEDMLLRTGAAFEALRSWGHPLMEFDRNGKDQVFLGASQ